MISLKNGVTISKLQAPMVVGLMIIDGCYAQLGFACVITAGDDGTHKVGSLHYEGKALDFRTKHVPRDKLDALLGLIAARLGDQDFEWLMESRDQPYEHLHVELDPH